MKFKWQARFVVLVCDSGTGESSYTDAQPDNCATIKIINSYNASEGKTKSAAPVGLAPSSYPESSSSLLLMLCLQVMTRIFCPTAQGNRIIFKMLLLVRLTQMTVRSSAVFILRFLF